MASEYMTAVRERGVECETSEKLDLGAGCFGSTCKELSPGDKLAVHIHEMYDETYYVNEGQVDFVVAGEKITVFEGESIYIPAGVLHSGVVSGKSVTSLTMVYNYQH